MMKTSDLMKLVDALVEAKVKKLVPQMVTEEVKRIVPQLLNEEVKKYAKIGVTPKKAAPEPIVEDTMLSMTELMRDEEDMHPQQLAEQAHRTFAPKVFTKNSTINNILNQTAQSMTGTKVDDKEALRRQLERQILAEEKMTNPNLYSQEEDIDETVYVGSRDMDKIASHSLRKSMPIPNSQAESIKTRVLKKELEMQAAAVTQGAQPKFDVLSLMARDFRQVLKKSKEKDGMH